MTIDRADTGPVTVPGPPFQLTGLDQGQLAAAPTIGQHNRDVYCGRLGYTPEELVKLHQTGII